MIRSIVLAIAATALFIGNVAGQEFFAPVGGYSLPPQDNALPTNASVAGGGRFIEPTQYLAPAYTDPAPEPFPASPAPYGNGPTYYPATTSYGTSADGYVQPATPYNAPSYAGSAAQSTGPPAYQPYTPPAYAPPAQQYPVTAMPTSGLTTGQAEMAASPAEPPTVLPAEAETPQASPDEPAAVGGSADEEGSGEDVEEAVELEEEVPREWYYAPIYWFDLWEGNVEIGLSGSEGNSQTLNYLLGLDAKRETDRHILDFDLKYDRKTANSEETAHRLFAEGRWELLFEDSAWTWFFHETTEYDEFKAFDIRLSYDTGLGRCLIKNEDTSLLARAGGGLSHEVGGSDEQMVPEAVFGMEFKHQLNERQKVSASAEYSPDVTDFLDYRLKSKATWEVLLDEATNLSLRVNILDRYDSTPDGKKANDLDYTLTLLWSF